jgi:transketolase
MDREDGLTMTGCDTVLGQKTSICELEAKAAEIRRLLVKVFGDTGGGHYGGCLSEIDILTALYFRVLKVDPKNPRWDQRDRFVLSKGHGAGGLCATLAVRGFFDPELLSTYNQLDSPFGMHPDMNKIPGVDMSTGSLGLGFSAAVGMAIVGKREDAAWRVYSLLGDGECHEGIVWEAAMAARHYKLDNLVAIVDRNTLSMDGATEEVMSLEPFAAKWEAFGWSVRIVNGHNMQELVEALEAVPFTPGKPSVIIARTVKGKGISFIENRWDYHYATFNSEQDERARKDLGIL